MPDFIKKYSRGWGQLLLRSKKNWNVYCNLNHYLCQAFSYYFTEPTEGESMPSSNSLCVKLSQRANQSHPEAANQQSGARAASHVCNKKQTVVLLVKYNQKMH